MAATLGVATFEYAPYALFNLICPVLAVIFGYLMIAQPRAWAAAPMTAAQWDFRDPYLWSVTTVEAIHIDALAHARNTHHAEWCMRPRGAYDRSRLGAEDYQRLDRAAHSPTLSTTI